ncbi:MAG: hypothetical protein SGARI_003280 [Bacillariaceae sp.]
MLDLAIIYGNIGAGRKFKLDSVLTLEEILEAQARHDDASFALSKLASLVIFRSIEVYPTLSKSWWEMHCPSKLTSAVQDFVEAEVSPKVLQTSLETIQYATAFGEMQVKGSSTTREVTATYVQDDFTLSVMVKIPPSFPFRRAEVDCSKTLGVPAAKSKRWSLIIAQMINNQGGTLKDALTLWKENVDKEFEGVEPCPVYAQTSKSGVQDLPQSVSQRLSPAMVRKQQQNLLRHLPTALARKEDIVGFPRS